MHRGYVKLWRKITDNPWLKDSDAFHLWVRLLLLATHKPIEVIFFGKATILKPGQLITSRLSLEKLTGINQHKIDRLLTRYKTAHQIEQVTDYRSRLITILNWSEYQNNEQVNEQVMSRLCAGGEHTQEYKNIRKKEDIDKSISRKVAHSNKTNSEFCEKVIQLLNDICNKSFRFNIKATEALILARKAEGATIEDFRALIEKKNEDWGRDGDRRKYLRPETLFTAKHFESYLAEAKDHITTRRPGD